MAKKKHNAFGEFVWEEYMLKRKNSNKPMSAMFSDPNIKRKWESCDEKTRQRFKDIATSKNDGTYDHNIHHRTLKAIEGPNSNRTLIKIEDDLKFSVSIHPIHLETEGDLKPITTNQPLFIKDEFRPTTSNQSIAIKNEMRPTTSNQSSCTANYQEPTTSHKFENVSDDIKGALNNQIVGQTDDTKTTTDVQSDIQQLPGISGLSNLKNPSKECGQRKSVYDDMMYEFMAGYRLYYQCRDIIYSKSPEQLVQEPMFSFSCNVMCTDIGEDNDLYIPLEISIYAYTLRDGVPRSKPLYHTFIDPGPPPTGKMLEAKDHFQKHKVPFMPMAPFLEYARTDYRTIYEEILEYVGEERIILCQSVDYLDQVHGVLKWLAKKANAKPEKKFGGLIKPRVNSLPLADAWTVFDIKDYVYILGRYLNCPLASSVQIEMELNNQRFDWLEDYQCDWHKHEENETKWCAKSCAKRTINNLSDMLEWFHDKLKSETSNSELPN